jgi:hypothetical protein
MSIGGNIASEAAAQEIKDFTVSLISREILESSSEGRDLNFESVLKQIVQKCNSIISQSRKGWY